MAAVGYNRDAYNTCLCGGCPVNRASACIRSRQEKWVEFRKAVGKVLEQYHDHPEAFSESEKLMGRYGRRRRCTSY